MSSAWKLAKSSIDLPLIVLLGSTATGKSKLGIILAKAFNGEIISADSMQVYRGLDIITNKVSREEQSEVRHHMINIIDPPSEFTVAQFKDMALKIINRLHCENKIPIVVGGTNYYIESLLWKFLVDNQESEVANIKAGLQERKEISGEKNDLYERLKTVDPERAEQLHPNNIRKIARSLQIYDVTGQPHSEILQKQKFEDGASKLSGPLRFPKTLVFWLTCKQSVLDERISNRVEQMVSCGLADEITQFYKLYTERSNKIKGDRQQKQVDNSEVHTSSKDEKKIGDERPFQNLLGDNIMENDAEEMVAHGSLVPTAKFHVDVGNDIPCTSSSDSNQALPRNGCVYNEGLFQAIGLKEFHSYLTTSATDAGIKDKSFCDGLEILKRTTIKYSKKQRTWVRNRFLARPIHNIPDVYELDVTNLETWDKNVLEKARQITEAFITNTRVSFHPLERVVLDGSIDKNRKHVCEKCNGKIIIGDHCWDEHLKSRKHRRMTNKRKKPFDNN